MALLFVLSRIWTRCFLFCPGDICTLPKVVGPCEAAIVSWFFNSRTQECERFLYGGCQGNENRFSTEEECCRTCSSKGTDSKINENTEQKRVLVVLNFCCKITSKHDATTRTFSVFITDICTLPIDPGFCKARFPRWAYNSNTGRCERFYYGGCQGNDNNFQTLEECTGRCGGKSEFLVYQFLLFSAKNLCNQGSFLMVR